MSRHTVKRSLGKRRHSKTRLRRGRRLQRGGGDFKRMANTITEESTAANKEYYLELAKDLLGKIGSSRADLVGEAYNLGEAYNSGEFDIDGQRAKLMELRNKFKSEWNTLNDTVKYYTREGNNSSRPEGSRYAYSNSNVAYEDNRKRRDHRKLMMTQRDRASTNFSNVFNALVNLNSKDAILKELKCNLESSCDTQMWPLDLKKGIFDGSKRRQWLEDRANAIFEEQVNLLKSLPYDPVA